MHRRIPNSARSAGLLLSSPQQAGGYPGAPLYENRFGFFLQDEWTLHPDLHLIPGFRYDLDTFIDPTFSPRVSLIYQLGKDHTLRTTFAQAYQPN